MQEKSAEFTPAKQIRVLVRKMVAETSGRTRSEVQETPAYRGESCFSFNESVERQSFFYRY